MGKIRNFLGVYAGVVIGLSIAAGISNLIGCGQYDRAKEDMAKTEYINGTTEAYGRAVNYLNAEKVCGLMAFIDRFQTKNSRTACLEYINSHPEIKSDGKEWANNHRESEIGVYYQIQ